MIILNNEYLDKRDVNDNMSIYNKYSDQSIEYIVYTLKAGLHFTLRPPKLKEGVEIYWVSVGRLRRISDNQEIAFKDAIILKPGNAYICLEAMEDTELICVTSLTGSFSDTENSFKFVIETMGKLQKKDDYTEEHCMRVVELANKMAPYLNLTEKEIYAFLRASKYHDIGKISIPDEILNKPAKLTDEEYKKMKEHVENCKKYLEDYYEPAVLEIIFHHHERLDGSGYPLGLKENEISELGKALAVIDAFDAMTTERVYKRAKSKEEAIKELYSLAGKHFDVKYIEILEKII